MANYHWYVGVRPDKQRVVLLEFWPPTPETHSDRYNEVIGPFRTRKGAEYMAQHGANNPHLQTVADAERIVKAERLHS